MNSQPHANQNIADLLKTVLKKHNVPALAVAILSSEGMVAQEVLGVRKVGTNVLATLDDQWHLGSCSKTITATLIARFIEQGKINWNTTLIEVFPELEAHFHPGFKAVTLLHLLCHFAGLPANVDYDRVAKAGSIKEQRLEVLKEATLKPSEFTPTTKFSYSNVGFIILGAILERISGSSWEELIQKEIFLPLKMEHAGFGGMGTPGKEDQPWGHSFDGKPADTNGPDADNPMVLGPAGRIHCSLGDWSKFVIDQLRGARGNNGLLKVETYTKLQTPPFGDVYACGWGNSKSKMTGTTVLTHAGCNTMNYAIVLMAPHEDFAILVCTNQGGENGEKACTEALKALISFQKEK
jgi:CubicO group peptidase (beta-lactamase class C family)